MLTPEPNLLFAFHTYQTLFRIADNHNTIRCSSIGLECNAPYCRLDYQNDVLAVLSVLYNRDRPVLLMCRYWNAQQERVLSLYGEMWVIVCAGGWQVLQTPIFLEDGEMAASQTDQYLSRSGSVVVSRFVSRIQWTVVAFKAMRSLMENGKRFDVVVT